jgi:3-hydroxyisobutyrate dehydrogenase-like beta-hydroxyacid dehydrogenase
MAYEHEVFISYSSSDREWARKLHGDLAGRGVKAFFDQTSLREGEGWEGQIKAALLDSRHLVCLWSAKASASQWVQRELATFDAMKTPAAAHADGALLIVKLDDTFNAYSSLQQMAEAPITDAYAAGLPTLQEDDWRHLIDRINAAVKRD